MTTTCIYWSCCVLDDLCEGRVRSKYKAGNIKGDSKTALLGSFLSSNIGDGLYGDGVSLGGPGHEPEGDLHLKLVLLRALRVWVVTNIQVQVDFLVSLRITTIIQFEQ